MTVLRMGLLASRHDDDVSAARVLATNRASKIRKLADADCEDIALKFLDSLHADVEDFLKSARGKRALARSPQLATELRRIVVVERALFPPED